MQRFEAAPWPTSLKVVSLIGAAVLVAVGIGAARAIPHGTRVPFAETFGTFVSFVPPAIALFALLFVVRAYEVSPGELRVQRLLWTTRLDLAGLRRAWHDPDAMCGSLRVFGNGGLFSFTGLYQSRSLGRYRAFVTDPKKAVVLVLPARTLVLSPAEPRALVEGLHAFFPRIESGPPAGGG